VELRNAAGVAVATWNAGTSVARKTAPASWMVESNVFTISGSELRLKNCSSDLAAGLYTIRVKAADSAGNSLVRLLTIERTPGSAGTVLLVR